MNTVYNNIVIGDEFEDQLLTKLDVNRFLTVDSTLTESEGMTKRVKKYAGTGGVEHLTKGQGNSNDMAIAVTYKDYPVGCTQGRWPYQDEEYMDDNTAIVAGQNYILTQMVNDYTSRAIAEFGKATNVLYNCTWKYSDVIDACAMLDREGIDGFFMLINPEQEACFKKNLKDDLKYVESFVRAGYIRSVNGMPVYTTKAVTAGDAFIANNEAVTAFLKAGTTVTMDRDENTRTNYMYIRKYDVVALTHDDKVVKLTSSSEPEPPEDEEEENPVVG